MKNISRREFFVEAARYLGISFAAAETLRLTAQDQPNRGLSITEIKVPTAFMIATNDCAATHLLLPGDQIRLQRFVEIVTDSKTGKSKAVPDASQLSLFMRNSRGEVRQEATYVQNLSYPYAYKPIKVVNGKLDAQSVANLAEASRAVGLPTHPLVQVPLAEAFAKPRRADDSSRIQICYPPGMRLVCRLGTARGGDQSVFKGCSVEVVR